MVMQKYSSVVRINFLILPARCGPHKKNGFQGYSLVQITMFNGGRHYKATKKHHGDILNKLKIAL